MFLIRKPDDEQIRRFIASERDAPFSYKEIGATRTNPPAGFFLDHNRIELGCGEAVFLSAVRALTCWKMFDLGWVQVCWPDSPIVEGQVVAVLARHFGLWSLNACRIVYVIDEDGPLRRFGFAYGTLTEHAERGEERFSIEWAREGDAVFYDILAFSRPNHRLAKLGLPVARMLQKKFAADSKQSMLRAVAGSSED
jgi:uncharacterized protein (UPF0548 family)